MNDFKTMQDTHMAMLARQDANPDDPDLTRDAQAFINEAVVGSTFLSDPGERDLLRADGLGEKVGGLDRRVTLDDLLAGVSR